MNEANYAGGDDFGGKCFNLRPDPARVPRVKIHGKVRQTARKDMDPEIRELADMLETTQALLAKHEERHCSDWLAKDAQRVRNLDLYGVEHLLSAFGGMGSINDLVIHPINGHSIQASEVDSVNEQLGMLLNKISTLAKKLYGEEANARHSL